MPIPNRFSRRLLLGGLLTGGGLSISSNAGGKEAVRAAPKRHRVNSRDFDIPPNSTRDVSQKIQGAIQALAEGGGGVLEIDPGTYHCHGLEIGQSVSLKGLGNVTLKQNAAWPVVLAEGVADFEISNLLVEGQAGPAFNQFDRGLIELRGGEDRLIGRLNNIVVRGSRFHGICIFDAAATLDQCTITDCGGYGIFIDSANKVVVQNSIISKIGNNGIRIERPSPEQVDVQVVCNQIERVRSDWGGDGPNGNAISVWRAHGVTVERNQIRACQFSAIRTAEGNYCRMVNNDCVGFGETGIYMEFGASGALVHGNRLEQTAQEGIALTNWNYGGRQAICTDNQLRDIGTIGITVEAESIVQNNIIDGAEFGIVVGHGPYQDHVLVNANMILETGAGGRLQHGILVSSDTGAGQAFVSNNVVSGSQGPPIFGHDRRRPVPLADNIKLMNNAPGLKRAYLPSKPLGGSLNFDPDAQTMLTGGPKGWEKIS